MKSLNRYQEPGYVFFRVFGFIVHAKDTRRHRLYFSERNGLGPRAITIGAWRISILKD